MWKNWALAGVFITGFANAQDAAAPAPPKIGSLIQLWTGYDSVNAPNFNFRVRRAEIALSGSLSEVYRYKLLADLSKALKPGAVSLTNDNKILQDVWVSANLSPIEIQVGQFKTPTFAEGLRPSGELLFPERSILARSYDDARDLGVQVKATLGWFVLKLMVSNGVNLNTDDTTAGKDLSIRAEAKPTDAFDFALFTQFGDLNLGTKSRLGGGVGVSVSSLRLDAEAATTNDASGSLAGQGLGMNAEVSYTFDVFQPALRYCWMNTGTVSGITDLSVGLNIFLKKAVKLQLAVSVLGNMVPGDVTSTSTFGTPKVSAGSSGSLGLASLQAQI